MYCTVQHCLGSCEKLVDGHVLVTGTSAGYLSVFSKISVVVQSSSPCLPGIMHVSLNMSCPLCVLMSTPVSGGVSEHHSSVSVGELPCHGGSIPRQRSLLRAGPCETVCLQPAGCGPHTGSWQLALHQGSVCHAV